MSQPCGRREAGNLHWLLAISLIGGLFLTSDADAQTVTIGGKTYQVERVGGAEIVGESNDPGDFTQPTYLTQAPNDNNSLYIVERTEATNINNEMGRILKFDQQTNTSSVYLELSGTVVEDGGLATMAFHPDFANNGLFYVSANYVGTNGLRNRLLEFHDSGSGMPTLTRTLLEYSPLAHNYHTINWVGFQPGDESHQLFVTTGDGGTQANEPQFDPDLIESPDSLYGKIMRIDLETDFSAPASDTTHEGINVVSLGHRNPYRASFDESGGLFFGEVGFETVEELNYLTAEQLASSEIEDFGWTAREGTIATPTPGIGGPKGPNDIDPFFDYLHPGIDAPTVGYTGDTTVRGRSVTSGYLFDGRFYFGDFNFQNGRVFSGAWDGTELTDIQDHKDDLNDALDDGISFVVSFSTDNSGNLYILDFGNSFFPFIPGTGEIFRLVAPVVSGDFNGDGLVNLADYTVWRDNLGAGDDAVINNAGDGEAGVDAGDFAIWKMNFGGSDKAPANQQAPVPEPTSLAIAGVLAGLLAGFRGRRRRPASECRAGKVRLG